MRRLLILAAMALLAAANPAAAETKGKTGSSVGPGKATANVRVVKATKAPPVQDLAPVRSSHGDWDVRCQGDQCVLMQTVLAEEPKGVGLTVIFFKGSDKNPRLMRVVAPSGVLLPTGLGLSIDQGDVGRTGFVRCPSNGCIAEVTLDDALLGQLKKGKSATFIYFNTPEEGIGVPVSLKGFSAGFDALP